MISASSVSVAAWITPKSSRASPSTSRRLFAHHTASRDESASPEKDNANPLNESSLELANTSNDLFNPTFEFRFLHSLLAQVLYFALSANLDCFILYHNSAALRQQCLGKPVRGQVAAQSFFAGPIEDEARHCGELAAELVITRFVGEQGFLLRSSPFDPPPEKFAGLDRARRRGRDLGIPDVLRTEFAEIIILNPRLGPVDHHAVGVFV